MLDVWWDELGFGSAESWREWTTGWKDPRTGADAAAEGRANACRRGASSSPNPFPGGRRCSAVSPVSSSCLLILAPRRRHAGPPLMCSRCQRVVPSLAWGPGSGWKNPLADYDRPASPRTRTRSSARDSGARPHGDPATGGRLRLDRRRDRKGPLRRSARTSGARQGRAGAMRSRRSTSGTPSRRGVMTRGGASGRRRRPDGGRLCPRPPGTRRPGTDPEMGYAAALMTGQPRVPRRVGRAPESGSGRRTRRLGPRPNPRRAPATLGRPPRGLAGRGLALKAGRLPARVHQRAQPLVVHRPPPSWPGRAAAGRPRRRCRGPAEASSPRGWRSSPPRT